MGTIAVPDALRFDDGAGAVADPDAQAVRVGYGDGWQQCCEQGEVGGLHFSEALGRL